MPIKPERRSLQHEKALNEAIHKDMHYWKLLQAYYRGAMLEVKTKFDVLNEQYLSLAEDPILERDDCKVMCRSDEPVIDLESLEGLNADEAVFKVMEDNPGMEWEEAMQLLEIRNGDPDESGQLLRSLCWAAGRVN